MMPIVVPPMVMPPVMVPPVVMPPMMVPPVVMPPVMVPPVSPYMTMSRAPVRMMMMTIPTPVSVNGSDPSSRHSRQREAYRQNEQRKDPCHLSFERCLLHALTPLLL